MVARPDGLHSNWSHRGSLVSQLCESVRLIWAVTSAPGTYGFVALVVLSGVMELVIWQQDAKKEAGNFGDPVGFGQYTEDMRNKERTNGRLASVAALGIVSADLLTGKDGSQQLGLGAVRQRGHRHR